MEASKAPIEDSVNIPLGELSARVAELPPKNETVIIAGREELASEAVSLLTSLGRNATFTSEWSYGDNSPKGRLWSPNAWLEMCVANFEPARAIDLGCGTGRDAVFLAAGGWEVHAVDILPDSIERGKTLSIRYLDLYEQSRIQWEVANLLEEPVAQAESAGYDIVFNAYFFDRGLLAKAQSWLKPHGYLIVEAFTTIHQQRHLKPASNDRVVEPGEMASLVGGLELLLLEEGDHLGRHTARVLARKQ